MRVSWEQWRTRRSIFFDSRGDLIASNDNWRVGQESGFGEGGPYHAFQPSNDLESAIAVRLKAGAYTTILRGKGRQPASHWQRFTTTRTRAVPDLPVRSGDTVLIGGLMVRGDSSTKLVLRALGPSLSAYGIVNALAVPTLELHDGNGTLVRFNDNWGDNALQARQISLTGLAPTDIRESGMAVTLEPGNYTAIVRGKDTSFGLALFEVYDVQ